MAKLVFLDADDTFLTPPYAAVRRVAILLGKNDFPTEEEFIERQHIDFHQAFPEIFASKTRMWAMAFAALPFGFFRSYHLYPTCNPDLLKTLLDDPRVYVVSKNPPSFARARRDRLKALTGADLKDRYIACGPIFTKSTPKLAIIKKIAAKRGVALGDCLLVDDSLENIQEAASAGVSTILVDAPWNRAGREILTGLPGRALTCAREDFIAHAKAHLASGGDVSTETIVIIPRDERLLEMRAVRDVKKVTSEAGGSSRLRVFPLYKEARFNALRNDPHGRYIRAFRNLVSRPDFSRLDVMLADGRGIARTLSADEKAMFIPCDRHDVEVCALRMRSFAKGVFETNRWKFPVPALFNFHYHPRRQQVAEILEDRGVQDAIMDYVRTERTSLTEARDLALKHINLMIYNRKYRGCCFVHGILEFIFKRIFRSINVNYPQEIDGVEDKYFTVYAPIHRSYLDSGILYTVLGRVSQHFPYIVAADKMYRNWLGHMGAYTGAFYIKRKAADPIYSAVLSAHLKQVHRYGGSLEIFIEGMRSRSGLTLPPKKGIVASIDANRAELPHRKVAIVPVAFVYNKLPESEILLAEVFEDRRRDGKVSLREQADMLIKKKRRKTFFQKVRSFKRRLLATPISDCHIEFGAPVILGEGLPSVRVRESASPPGVQDYLNEVMFRINRATPVLPSSVACLGLLAAKDHHITAEYLADFMRFSHRLLGLYGVPDRLLFDIEKVEEHVNQTLRLPFINRKFKRARIDERWIISLSDLDLTRALHYRNNVLHYFVLPAMLANILTYTTSVRMQELHRYLDHLFNELSVKYFLPLVSDSATFITEVLKAFVECGYVAKHADSYVFKSEATDNAPFHLLSALADDFAHGDLLQAFSRFRRAFQRVELEIPAVLTMDGKKITATIHNLSIGGAFVSCAPTLHKDQVLTLSIPYQSQEQAFEGIVNRVEEAGSGIRFLQTNEGTNSLLMLIIRHYLEKSSSVGLAPEDLAEKAGV